MALKNYQREFLDFAIQTNVLRFGDFTLKSGRVSPYFFNSGLFNSGKSIATLGQFYAATINDSNINYDLLFGPAYKGIPLAVATTIAIANQYNIDVPYAFNRKEVKDHGEGGIIVGAKLFGKVLIIDDVITAGTSVRESIDTIKKENALPAGVVIAMDRQERGQGSSSAIQEIEGTFGISVTHIVSLNDLLTYLEDKANMKLHRNAIITYRDTYGC